MAADATGKQVFDKFCAECHAAGPGHPGTQRLGWNKGEASSLLEKRKDLSADYVRAIVRRGLFEMPPFRPTEVTDTELMALAEYLAQGRNLRRGELSKRAALARLCLWVQTWSVSAMSEIETAARRLVDGYRSSVLKADLDAFGALFADDVRIFDLWGPAWSFEGRAAWLQSVKGWFDSLGDETVRVSFEDIQVSGAQTVGVLTAVVTYAAISKAGAELRSLQNRLTWTFEKRGGDWQIVHEHTSAPVLHEGLKALLRRPPTS